MSHKREILKKYMEKNHELTLRDVRNITKTTQKQMAEYLKISPAAYSFKENNLREFNYSELKFVSKYFGITIEELIYLVEE